MTSLHIGTYGLKLKFPELAYGCCPANVCALIFNKSGKALKKISSTPDVWELTDYSKTSHADFCIQLNEHTERSFYYYIDFEDDTYTLLSSSPGDFYDVEFWYRLTTDYDYSRESDTLIDSQRFKWDSLSKSMIDCLISDNQKTNLSLMSPVASIAYDTSNQTVRILCWLQNNGVIVEDTITALITWRNFNGELIAEAQSFSHMIDSDGESIDGIFKFELSGITILPDYATPLVLEITDANSNVFKGCTSVVTYD